MAKKTLKIITPDGEFTRTTNTAYTHAVVRTSERAKETHDLFNAGDERTVSWGKTGVHGRWIKDRGFAVTWHGSERAAVAASLKPYLWCHKGIVLGIFPVEG